MLLTATKTPVTEIPIRAMLDLEEIGGEGFAAEYGVLVALDPTEGGVAMLVEHEGALHSFTVDASTTIPVITYIVSNTLEAQNQEVNR